MSNGMENIWIINIVTSVSFGSLLWFGFTRWVNQQDERYKKLISKVDNCDERSDKIEKNYLSRFDEVKKEINDSNNTMQRELTREIREITKDKTAADIIQVREMAEMKSEVKGLKERVEQVLRVVK